MGRPKGQSTMESWMIANGKSSEHFYETIERVTNGNRIELFARQKREGWDIWGNELENDVELEMSANNGR